MADKEKKEESKISDNNGEEDDEESEEDEDSEDNKENSKKENNKSVNSKKENNKSVNSKKENNKSVNSKKENNNIENNKTENNIINTTSNKELNNTTNKYNNTRFANKSKTIFNTSANNLNLNTNNSNSKTNNKNFLKNNIELAINEELNPPRPELEEIISQKIYLLNPSDEGPSHPRTIFFLNDPELNSNKKTQLYNLTQLDIDQKRYMILYKAYRNMPQSLSGVMKYNQLVKSKLYTNTNLIWKLLDKDKMYPLLRKLNKYQRYNHFPICWQLGRKDNLYMNYLKMKKKYKKEYDFTPNKYLLPQDRDIVQKNFKEYNIFNYDDLHIVKPVASARGKGVRILTDTTTIPTKGILEKYIYNPHLINKRKYDMRIYVLVTGFRPLKIYIYDNGIVRFCSDIYTLDADKLNNNYVHITNYSVNKAMEKVRKGEDIDIEATWSLLALKGYFIDKKLDFEKIWIRIKDIVIKTIISVFDLATPALRAFKLTSCNLFELYGFDFILDSKLNPWLLECNINPSLNCDDDIDLKVKSKLITDICNIIGLIPYTHDKREKPLDKYNYYINGIEEAVTESLCEFVRPTGGFERIFPLVDNIEHYKKFIDKPGEQNLSLWDNMMKYKHKE